jgi:hypothetical protein
MPEAASVSVSVDGQEAARFAVSPGEPPRKRTAKLPAGERLSLRIEAEVPTRLVLGDPHVKGVKSREAGG